MINYYAVCNIYTADGVDERFVPARNEFGNKQEMCKVANKASRTELH
jgi:hypothetical protein